MTTILLLLALAGAQGCSALEHVANFGYSTVQAADGPVETAATAGFWVGAVAATPATVALLPVTGLVAQADDTCHGAGAFATILLPNLVVGGVAGVAMAVPAAIAYAPFWLVGEAVEVVRTGARAQPPRASPPSRPPEAPLEELTEEVAAEPGEARPGTARPSEPAPALPSDGPRPSEAHARVAPDDPCCHGLAIAPLLPAHEHGAGLTQALFDALVNEEAAEDAERLLAARDDADQLLLRGLEDEVRAPVAARILVARADRPGVALGLAEVAGDEEAPRRVRLRARAVMLEIEAKRVREQATR